MNSVLNSQNGYIMNSPPAQQEYIMDPTQQQEYLVDQLYSRANHNYTLDNEDNGDQSMLNGEYSANQTNPFLPGFNGDADDAKGEQVKSLHANSSIYRHVFTASFFLFLITCKCSLCKLATNDLLVGWQLKEIL